jgi:hypothetical protein
MTPSSGSPGEMDETLRFLRMRDPLQLDDGTVDRLLDGMPVDDAPPSYRGVVELLSSLKAAPSAAELDGERQAVTTLISRSQQAARPSPPSRRSSVQRRLQLTGAALVGTATLLVGLGAAGALPGAAQGVASDVLSTVGVSTPNPDSHAGVHPDTRGRSGDASEAPSSDTAVGESSGAGATISGLATDDSTSGVDKGAAVSTEASDGHSQAGQHGDAAAPDTNTPAAANPPVVTPNPGGTTTADTASGGRSDTGTNTADSASGGRADAGSGNASAGLANRP